MFLIPYIIIDNLYLRLQLLDNLKPYLQCNSSPVRWCITQMLGCLPKWPCNIRAVIIWRRTFSHQYSGTQGHYQCSWRQILCQDSLMVAMDVTAYCLHQSSQQCILGPPIASDNPALWLGRLHSIPDKSKTVGVMNVPSNTLSWPSTPQAMEWMLHPEVFKWICTRLWMPNIDLFTTRFKWQLLVYVSPVTDP